jgi:uncharacterized membrane protein YphA (DoxX/SURF4 family)
MHQVSELLGAWSGFYVLIGSAAAGLTGLTFVVITLTADERLGTSQDGVSVFTTPTVVHFSCALFASALMAAPFRSFLPISIVLGLIGAFGVLQVARVARLTSNLRNYRPDIEDWSFNVVLPFVAYLALVAGALLLHGDAERALYVPAAAVALLILIGIHNAWDVVTFLAAGKADALPDDPEPGSKTG